MIPTTRLGIRRLNLPSNQHCIRQTAGLQSLYSFHVSKMCSAQFWQSRWAAAIPPQQREARP
jgi:hypothetical protein